MSSWSREFLSRHLNINQRKDPPRVRVSVMNQRLLQNGRWWRLTEVETNDLKAKAKSGLENIKRLMKLQREEKALKEKEEASTKAVRANAREAERRVLNPDSFIALVSSFEFINPISILLI
jgi:hypothetical protein